MKSYRVIFLLVVFGVLSDVNAMRSICSKSKSIVRHVVCSLLSKKLSSTGERLLRCRLEPSEIINRFPKHDNSLRSFSLLAKIYEKKLLNEQFIESVKKDDLDEVILLMCKDPDFNAVNKSGETALVSAVSRGYTDIVNVLLSVDIDVNASGYSRLPGDSFVNDIASWTPLMHAAYRGYSDIIQILLDEGADANIVSAHGNTAFRLALYNGDSENAKLLSRYLDFKNDNTLLIHVLESGHASKIIRALFDKNVGVDGFALDDGTTILNVKYQNYADIKDALNDVTANVLLARGVVFSGNIYSRSGLAVILFE